MICCEKFDISGGHKVEGSQGDDLKVAGRLLRSHTLEERNSGVEKILSIFSTNVPFCPVSVGLRRVLILFLNWLQALGFPTDRSGFLGSVLAIQISRFDPKLGRIFFTESLEVIRALVDIRDQQVELFPKFVCASRQVLGAAGEDGRGIVVQASSVVIKYLSETLEQLVRKFGENSFFQDAQVGGKFGLCLLALRCSSELADAYSILKSIPVPGHIVEANFEIWDSTGGDEEETQNVLGGNFEVETVSLTSCITLLNEGPLEDRETPEADGVNIDSLIRQLTHVGGGGILESLQNALLGKQKGWSIDMEQSLAIPMSSQGHKLDHLRYVFGPNWLKTKQVAGHIVGVLCWRANYQAVEILADLTSFPSVAELVVAHLHHPMLLHILSSLSQSVSALAPFVTRQVFDWKFTIAELVEANATELISLLIKTLSTRSLTKSVPLVRQIVSCVSSCSSVQRPSVAKKLKPSPSRENEPLSSFFLDHFLHLIELVEELRCPNALALLIASVDSETIKVFLVRVAESASKFPREKRLWKTLATVADNDDRILPLLLEASDRFELNVTGGKIGVLQSLESELKKERSVSCRISLLRLAVRELRNGKMMDVVGTDCNLLGVLGDIVRQNLGSAELVEIAGELISLLAFETLSVKSLNPPSVDSPSLAPQQFAETVEAFVVRFLAPRVKESSHGFAVQEILACMGSGFLDRFSQDMRVALGPYLTSSYRVGQPSSSPSVPNIQSIESFIQFLSDRISRQPMRAVIQGLLPAVTRDQGLASYLLPFALEQAGGDLEADFSAVMEGIRTLLSIPEDCEEMKKRVEINAVFAVMDYLSTLLLTATSVGRKPVVGTVMFQSITEMSDIADLELLVTASLFVEDFPRALKHQESLILARDAKIFQESDVLTLGGIYDRLSMAEGVVGACSLVQRSRKVEDLRLAKTGRFKDLILRFEQGEDIDNRILVDGGQYRSAIALADKVMDDRIMEACWRLSDWSSTAGPEKETAKGTFNGEFCQLLRGEEMSGCASGLVRNLALTGDKTNVEKLLLLRVARETCCEEEFIKMLEAGRGCESVFLLEGMLAIAKSKFPMTVPSVTESLLNVLRKQSNVVRLKQLLPVAKSIVSPSAYAKAAWFVGELSEAQTFLQMSSDTSESTQLLSLQYTAAMERSIPKLVISGYRELLKTAATDSSKGRVSFAFGEYLDRVGSAALTSQDTVVWNKSLLVQELVSNLLTALTYSVSGKKILFAINRLFQIHWELLHSGDSSQIKLATEIVAVFYSMWKQIPCWVWYVALPHLITRVGTSDFGTVCEDIVVNVLSEFPRQASWIVLPGLLNSKSPDRRAVGSRILQRAVEKSDYPNFQQLVSVVRVIAEALVAVARFDDARGMKCLNETKEGARLLRSTGGLLVVPVRAQIAPATILSAKGVFSTEQRIAKFQDSVFVYNTKAKPKRISVMDTEGREIFFILKLEKKTDLRKDARMMDFINVVNSEVGVHMRTYQVLTLAEDTGLIEFIPNLTTVRKIIDENLSKSGKSVGVFLNKEVMSKLSHKTDGFQFFKSMVETVPPILAEWFSKRFASPRHWLQARTTFTTTQALWSMAGYIVGLGDRHPDNILIDQFTGEIVHVDFDCIFSRGMMLTIPELVPFRLTRICVTGMGVSGVEGLFSSTCERTMGKLREKRKLLISVLHAFVADPLIDWQGGGTSFKKARDVVYAIDRKLNGFVDVGEMIDKGVEEKLISDKNSGLGKDRGAALATEGQVDELIRAAVCERNLAKMYLGWMPMF